jgi:hypothetical protein
MPHFCSSTSRRTQPPNGGHTPRTKVSLNNAQHARSRRHTRGHDVPKCPEYPLRAARKPVSILAFLALHLTLQPSNNTDRPLEHWQRVTNQAFDQAKEQVQLSLKNELGPPTKTKYKDQMMAPCALANFTVWYPTHCTCPFPVLDN